MFRRAFIKWRSRLLLGKPPNIPSDNVILSSYLTALPDPQSNTFVKNDDPELVAGWTESMAEQGLHGVILHDTLSDNFCSEVTMKSDGLIHFVRCLPSESLSVNDYRFFLFREFLAKHSFRTTFCTDLFDVRVKRNPHEMINGRYKLWVQKENDWTLDDRTNEGRWVLDIIVAAYGRVPPEVSGRPILNAGVWGGETADVLSFLFRITREIEKIHSANAQLNCNMAAFNRVLYRDYDGKIWANGEPLHSRFKQYELGADVCFIHK